MTAFGPWVKGFVFCFLFLFSKHVYIVGCKLYIESQYYDFWIPDVIYWLDPLEHKIAAYSHYIISLYKLQFCSVLSIELVWLYLSINIDPFQSVCEVCKQLVHGPKTIIYRLGNGSGLKARFPSGWAVELTGWAVELTGVLHNLEESNRNSRGKMHNHEGSSRNSHRKLFPQRNTEVSGLP